MAIAFDPLNESKVVDIEKAIGGAGNDKIYGGIVANELFGNDGNDIINGNGGNDTLIGGVGNDILIGGTDADGQDIDIADYSTRTKGLDIIINERATAPTQALSSTSAGARERDVIVGIERIEGTQYVDHIDMTVLPTGKPLTIDTGAGDDVVTIDGTLKPGSVIYLRGGNDKLTGNYAEAIIHGGDGEDVIDVSRARTSLFADADAGDRLTYFDKIVSGGIRWANSELQWAKGAISGLLFGGNVDGELVIRNKITNADVFISDFNFDPSGTDRMAGILVGTGSLAGYRLAEAPTGYIYSTFETLMGPMLKAITGHSYFQGVDLLVLDLDGDGIELNARTGISPRFDIDGDGFAEQTGWLRGDDGFLVRDLNANGSIDDVSEMFGSAGVSGFAALAALDSNADGIIDASDTDFASLRIWKDTNGNAVTDAGELLTLAQAGVESITLTPTDTTPQTVANNIIVATGSFTRTDSTTGTIADVNFAVNQRDTVWLGDTTIDSTAAALPEIKGFGTLTDLRIAMTDSASLASTVASILPSLNTPDLAALRAAVTPALTAWANAVPVPAGTPGLSPHVGVPIRAGTTTQGGSVVYDFAYQTTDINGTYWKLASGNAVLDENAVVIDYPTYADILAQTAAEGAWTEFSGAQIQFLERYMGNPLPIGVENLSNVNAINAASTLIDQMWETLNQVAVRLAIQGPLAAMFDGTVYNPETNHFEAATDRQLVPTFEAIFSAAPSGASAAEAYLAEWKPVLDIVMQDYDRGADYLQVSYGFLFQNIVAAYENVGLAASLTQAAAALDIPTDLIQIGTGTVTGSEDADLFYLNAGDQTLQGGIGPDSYIVGANFGQDVIDDYEAPLHNSPDMLRFAHLTADDITMQRDGMDLIISVIGETDTLRIVGQFEGQRSAPGVGAIDPDYGIQEIVFADGMVWDRLDIAKALLPTFTSGDDTIAGTDTIDFIEAGAGNDSLAGAGEGDVYLFGAGDGKDTITDNIGYIFVDSPDLVQFKPGITEEDITFSRVGNSNDLIISLNGTTDQITIFDQFVASYTGGYGTQWLNRIEGFHFSDGQTLLWTDAMTRIIEALQTSGNDTVYGFSVEDTLDGGEGDDYLSGGNENDTYILGLGYGHDIIEDRKGNILSGGTDILQFGDDVLSTEVTLSRATDSDDFTITLVDGTSALIKGQFALTIALGVYEFDRLEELQFADGTIWTYNDVQQKLIDQSSTAGNDSIYGFTREDILQGGKGDDYMAGGFEGDIYIYSSGDGNDTIYDQSYTLAAGSREDKDTLKLTDINASDITLERTQGNDNIIIRVTATNETITLKDQGASAISGSTTELETIEFANGTIWTAADLQQQYLSHAGTAGNDYIAGFSGSDTLDGGAGNDTLEGGGRGDTYRFGIGYGQDTIMDYIGYITWDYPDTVAFGAGITTADLILSHVGDDLVIQINGTSDQLTITDHFYGGLDGDFWAIENFSFADGTTLDQQGIAALLTASQGTGGNDTIIGSEYQETLTGGQGDDLLMAAEGSDRYVYNAGDGQDTISDAQDFYALDTDTLVFGPGISPEQLVLTRGSDPHDLFISFTGAAGSILITDQYYKIAGYASYGIEKFQFNDGTVWNQNQINAAMFSNLATSGNDSINGYNAVNDSIVGGAGNDTLNGLSGDDTLVGGTGSNVLIGGDGADIFIMSPGESATVISDFTPGQDQIDFSAIGGASSLSTLSIVQNGADTTITTSTSLAITLAGVTATALSDSDFLWYTGTVGATVNGTSGADSLTGSAYDDTLTGGLGDDTIAAGDGDDLIHSGFGHDVIDGGSGVDTVSYAGASSAIFTDLGSGNPWLFYGSTSIDQITNVENVTGSDYNDSISGNAEANLIYGGLGNDRVYAMAGNDTLYGGEGNDALSGDEGDDFIMGGLGNDFMDGGDGIDTVSYADIAAGVTVNLAGNTGGQGIAGSDSLINVEHLIATAYNDLLIGNGSNNRFEAGAGNDVLVGNGGNDTLLGGAGNDTLTADAGSDLLTGGDGLDYYKVMNTASAATISDFAVGAEKIDLLDFASVGGFSTLNIAQSGADTAITIARNGTGNGSMVLTLTGITASALTADDFVMNAAVGTEIEGTAGNDVLTGGDGNDLIIGGAGNDTLSGGAGNDTIIAGDGDDAANSGFGHDVINGGSGIDMVSYSTATAAVFTDIGSDNPWLFNPNTPIDQITNVENVTGSDYNDSIAGNADGNLIYGGLGDDRIHAMAGNDTLYGGDGNDAISAWEGDDLIIGGLGADFIDGAEGDDTISYSDITSAVTVNLAGNAGGNSAVGNDWVMNVEHVIGTAYNDTVIGDTADNRLDGAAGNDTLLGGDGNDSLIGGVGIDSLTGGNGADYYIYSAVSDSGTGSGTRDIIADFSHAQGDLIDLSGFTGTFSFLGTGAFTGTAQELNYALSGGNTLVALDANADGTADMELWLTGTHTLVSGDFVL